MNLNAKYIGYQLKRALCHGPQMLIGAIVLALTVGTIAFYTYRSAAADENGSSFTVPVGVVADDPGESLEFVIGYLSGMPGVSEQFSFEIMDEQDAYKALGSGELAAVMLVPSSSLSDIVSKKGGAIRILLSEKNPLAAIFLQELSEAGASMLASAQASSHTLYNAFTIAQRDESEADPIDDEYDVYTLTYTLTRGELFHVKGGSAGASSSVTMRYLASGILLFLLFFGICYLSFYSHDSDSLRAKACSCGISKIVSPLSGLLGILMYQLFLFLCVLIAMPYLAHRFMLSLGECVCMLIISLFLLLSIGIFFFLLYELIPTAGYAMLFVFLASGLMMLLGGYLIPNAFLPSWCRHIADFLPVRCWMNELFHLFDYPTNQLDSHIPLIDRNFLIMNVFSLCFLTIGFLTNLLRAGRKKL